MNNQDEIELDGTDLLLLVGIAIVSVITLILLPPVVWGWCLGALGWCLGVLDPRNWSRWVWIGLNAAVVVVLIWMCARRRGAGDG